MNQIKNDLHEIFSNYPTKTEFEMMLKRSERRTYERAKRYHNEILAKIDRIFELLAQIREDRLFEKQEKGELTDKIDDYEERIKKLEKKQTN